jgi:hypothetical protein
LCAGIVGVIAVVRRVDSKRGDGGELRAFLLAEATALLGAFNGHPWPLDRPSTYEPTEDALDGPFGDVVRQLAGGEAYRLRSNDFPDWTRERFASDVNDEFELGADNVLRPL